ncbi:MAG TPA: hypothetical protein ENN56_01290, partial [Firmicutes bacterium]|nr:hypothetical protein [Bacillota bacterium]
MAAEEQNGKKWWRHWWVWVIGLPVALLVFTAFAAEYTSRSSFCVTCHYMVPFYESWQESEHHDIECVQCHFPPGMAGKIKGKVNGLYQVAAYVTQAYRRSRPWAEIEDASCMRSGCHDSGILSDTNIVIFKNVAFTHGSHLNEPRRDRQLRCTSCHSQIVQGEHMLVTTSTCALCHLWHGGVLADDNPRQTESGECRLCHTMTAETRPQNHPNVDKLDVACVSCHGKTTIGDGAVSLDRCYQCHFERDRLDRYDEHVLLHQIHITDNKIDCLNCHTRIQHKTVIAQEVAQLDCQGCHPNLHEPQHTLFTGRGAHMVPNMPNAMFSRGIQCQSCHVYHREVSFPDEAELGETVYADEDACAQCHGRGFTGLVEQWNSFIYRRLSDLEGIDRRVRTRARPITDARVASLLDSVSYNMRVVRDGHPVHNAVYAKAILDSTYSLLRTVANSVEPRISLPPFDTNVGIDVPGACRTCHFAIETVNVRAFGEYPFSHNIHAVQQQLPCEMCHSNTATHGEHIVTPSDCTDCHHTTEKPNQCAV